MILLVDNDDSFTYNIVEMLYRITDKKIITVRSGRLDIHDVEKYEKVIFSPGPSLPSDFPIMREILSHYMDRKPILGICLGHQAICEFFGAKIKRLPSVMHGIDSTIICDRNSMLFRNKTKMIVGRYHSWVACNVPTSLKITATDEKGYLMAIEHVSLPIYGVQFHPESYITQDGASIFDNFINTN